MFLTTRLRSGASQVLLTVIVFSMASGIVGGLILYVDNATPQVYDEVTSGTPVDLTVEFASSIYSSNVSFQEIMDIVSSQDLVTNVALAGYYSEHIWYWNEGDTYYLSNTYLGVKDGIFDKFPDAVSPDTDNGPIVGNNCWLSVQELSDKNLEIGDHYILNISLWNSTDYYVYPVSLNLTIVGSFTSTLFKDYYYYDWESPPESSLKVILDYDLFNSTFGYRTDYADGRYRDILWVDVDSEMIQHINPAELESRLDLLEKRIEQEALPYAFVDWDGFPLQDVLSNYIAWAMAMRLVSIGFSIPTIIMGIMLVYYDSVLGSDPIRRDVGTLKTRGSSGRQAFFWVMTRALTVAMFGAFGAIVTGMISAILAGTVRTFLEFDLTRLATLTFFAQPTTIAFAFAFSFVLGVLVALPVAYKSLVVSASEAHQVLESDVLKGTEKMGNPLGELACLGISFYCITPFLFMSAYVMTSPTAFTSIMIITIPLLAALILTFSHLLARPTSSIKGAILGRLTFKYLQVPARVLSRNARLHKRSEATAVLFITMVFTASVLASVSAVTGYNHMQNLYKFQVGSDITLEVKADANNVTLDLLDEMRQIDGVEAVSGIVKVTGRVWYRTIDYLGYAYTENTTVNIWGIDSASWVRSAFLLPYFTAEHNVFDAFNQMDLDNTSVITSFKPVSRWVQVDFDLVPEYHNDITVRLYHSNETLGLMNTTQCTILDVLGQLGRYSSTTYFPGYPQIETFVIMNLDYVVATTNVTRVEKFYVKLKPSADVQQVKHDLIALSPGEFKNVYSVQELIDDALESRAGQTIYGIYTLSVVFVVIFMTIGVTIVAMMRIRKMKRSFSILRALGTDTNPIGITVVIDTVITIFLAMLIGSLLGYFLSTKISQIPLVFTGIQDTFAWMRLPVDIVVPMSIIGPLYLLTYVVGIISSYLFSRVHLRKNIAEAIQYVE